MTDETAAALGNVLARLLPQLDERQQRLTSGAAARVARARSPGQEDRPGHRQPLPVSLGPPTGTGPPGSLRVHNPALAALLGTAQSLRFSQW